jgi:hypothetical protein
VGQVRVDAITAGVIAAASFAAGAIDATAIAAGAIDAATFAANAIDATAIAGDAITNAKIADGALSEEQFDNAAIAAVVGGIEVVRATEALPQTAIGTLFTVATGRVKLIDLIGEVTAQIGAVPNDVHIQFNPTGAGAETNLCAAGTDVNALNVGCQLSITGTLANALVASYDIPFVYQATPLVLPPGTIEIHAVASDGGGGLVSWTAHYIPLEAGATLVATGP